MISLVTPLRLAGGLAVALWCLAGAPAGQAAPIPLRVLTYNIHHGAGTDGKLDLARVAEVIKSTQPDLVALQEVDKNTRRTDKVDQTAELGRLTGLHSVFGKAIDYGGGQYGAAILSRWPFQDVSTQVLPASSGHELRPALVVKIKPSPSAPELSFVSVHLDHQVEEERLAQAKRLLQLLAPDHERPIILAGDFNALPDSPVLQLFAAWTNTTAGQERFTIPSHQPNRQIDYILCSPAGHWRVTDTQVLQTPASDHCPLLVLLEWTPLSATDQ